MRFLPRPHLLTLVRSSITKFPAILLPAPRRRDYSETSKHNPLRVLFCGADEFSIYSLRAIRELQCQKPHTISSLDVVCRPDKRVGRGLKQIQEVPIKKAAEELQLPIHQIDTFTGWTPPFPVNLVVTVSFGLLVPPRILNGATYGGLNVHPSLLPDLRGPAPIQHALLKQHHHTGVSLQTMHPTRFDHGVILDQTAPPGVPIPLDATPGQLIQLLGPLGASMLRRGIEKRLFENPAEVVLPDSNSSEPLQHASKVTPEDRHLDWSMWTADQIVRRDRVLGRLWDTTTYQACFRGVETKRITYHGPWRVVSADRELSPLELVQWRSEVRDLEQCGRPCHIYLPGDSKPHFAIRTLDGLFMCPASATLEGKQKGKALQALLNAVMS